MYETMKPKEAAKIFDRLDIKVLIDVATQMKPQIMSAILAQMSPENAERLTVELAAKSGSDRDAQSVQPAEDRRPPDRRLRLSCRSQKSCRALNRRARTPSVSRSPDDGVVS